MIHSVWPTRPPGPPPAEANVRYQALVVMGNQGLAQWQTTFVLIASANQVELDGILIAEFDDAGKCSEIREWWHRRETDNSSSSP